MKENVNGACYWQYQFGGYCCMVISRVIWMFARALLGILGVSWWFSEITFYQDPHLCDSLYIGPLLLLQR